MTITTPTETCDTERSITLTQQSVDLFIEGTIDQDQRKIEEAYRICQSDVLCVRMTFEHFVLNYTTFAPRYGHSTSKGLEPEDLIGKIIVFHSKGMLHGPRITGTFYDIDFNILHFYTIDGTINSRGRIPWYIPANQPNPIMRENDFYTAGINEEPDRHKALYVCYGVQQSGLLRDMSDGERAALAVTVKKALDKRMTKTELRRVVIDHCQRAASHANLEEKWG